MEGENKFYAINLEQRVKVPMLNCSPKDIMFAHSEDETGALYNVFKKHVKINAKALPLRRAVAKSALEEFQNFDLENQVYEMPTEAYVNDLKLDSHTAIYREKIRESLAKNIENKRSATYSHNECILLAAKILEAKKRYDSIEKNLGQEELDFGFLDFSLDSVGKDTLQLELEF